MFGSEIVEVAIGLVFVYLIASLVATAIREAIEGVLKTRAIHLERGIRQLLDDPSGTTVTKELFDHPMLFGLFAGEYDPNQLTNFFFKRRRGGKFTGANGTVTSPRRAPLFTDLPAYIPSGNFALALMHVVAGTTGTEGVLSMASVRDGTMLLPDGRLKKAMLVAIGEGQGDLDRARASLEAWFDGTMDRVSGWYKRETSWILFVIGLLTAVALNVDTLTIARNLATNNTLRQQLVARVDTAYPGARRSTPLSESELRAQVDGLSNIIGYGALRNLQRSDLEAESETTFKGRPVERQAWIDAETVKWLPWLSYLARSVPGWIISGLAISLGAPFWFDVLNKLMVIRSTVKPYEKSAPEASADRGAEKRVDALAPVAAAGAGAGPAAAPRGGVPVVAEARPGGDQGSTASPQEDAVPTSTLRLAFDGADPATITFTRSGIPVEVPADNFLELPLAVGTEHLLEANGTDKGRPVTWSQTVKVTEDDDRRPVAATLA